MDARLPAGFRRAPGSGLLLPDAVSRAREVWTRDEYKGLDRVTKFLESRGIHLFLRCPDPACKDAPIQQIRRTDGGVTLRCGHKDREVRTG